MKITNNKKKKKEELKNRLWVEDRKLESHLSQSFSAFRRWCGRKLKETPFCRTAAKGFFCCFFFLSDVTWMRNSRVRNKIREDRRRVNEWRSGFHRHWIFQPTKSLKHSAKHNTTTAVLLHLPPLQLLMMSRLLAPVARQRRRSRVIVAGLILFLRCKHTAAGFIMKSSRDHQGAAFLFIFFICLSFRGGFDQSARQSLSEDVMWSVAALKSQEWPRDEEKLDRSTAVSLFIFKSCQQDFLIITSADRLQRPEPATPQSSDLAPSRGGAN